MKRASEEGERTTIPDVSHPPQPRLVRGTPSPPCGPYDPALDIALDEVLLETARPAARVWTPPGRAVVIGIASKVAAEVNLDEAGLDQCLVFPSGPPVESLRVVQHVERRRCPHHAAGIPVRRRFSGGSGVLLAPGVVCFSLVFPYADYCKAGTPVDTIGGAYRLATSLVAGALSALGLGTTFEPPGDLAVSDRGIIRRKIAGFAQARRREAVLVHGVVPVSLDGAELDRLLGPPARLSDPPAYRRGRPHSEFVTDLRRELGSCEVAEVEEALAEAFVGQDALEEDFTPEEIEKARSLVERKYSKNEWNLRR